MKLKIKHWSKKKIIRSNEEKKGKLKKIKRKWQSKVKKEQRKKNQGLIKKRRKTSWKRVIDKKKYTKVFQDVMEESVSMWRKKTIHAMLLSKLKSILMLES